MLQVGTRRNVEKLETRGLHTIKDRQVSSKSNAIESKSINSPEQGSKLKRKNSGLAITAIPIRRGHFHATVLSKIDTQMSYAFSWTRAESGFISNRRRLPAKPVAP